MTVLLGFDNIHCAGRFDQSVVAFDHQMDSMMDEAHAVGVTEIDKNARARHLNPPGWDGVWGDKGPRDDCGITTLKSKFRTIHEETYTTSHHTYVNERGHKTDTTEAAFKVVEDTDSGELVLLGELHTPHGMGPQLRADKVRSDVARAYVDISRGYLRRANQLMRKYKIKYAALSGDWNLNFRFAWVRAYFRQNFAGWQLNWNYLGLPDHGTHGPEIIDGTLLRRLKPTHREMLKRFTGDDHSGYLEHLVAIKHKIKLRSKK